MLIKDFIRGYRGNEHNFLERLAKFINLTGRIADISGGVSIFSFDSENIIAFTVEYTPIVVIYIYSHNSKELIWMGKNRRSEIKKYTNVELDQISDLPFIAGKIGPGTDITREEIFPRQYLKSAKSY